LQLISPSGLRLLRARNDADVRFWHKADVAPERIDVRWVNPLSVLPYV
jgi:hypothetical protein